MYVHMNMGIHILFLLLITQGVIDATLQLC